MLNIISLNTWGGRAGKDKLLNFFKQNKDNIDVFCLQEMWRAPYDDYNGFSAGGMPINQENIMTRGVQEVSEILSDFESYFRPHFLDNYGLQIFVNKKLKVLEEGEVFVFREKGYIPDDDIGKHARNIQYVVISYNEEKYIVINFHGLWNGKGKIDCDDRIKQSQNIIDFIKTRTEKVILCGDFNLLPETVSLQMFEESGLKNLIKDYKIKSTRSAFYNKPEKFADYLFLSKNVEVDTFRVLEDEVSDHLPLFVSVR